MPWQDKGGHVNPEAWNKVANMLYLESPAGSGTAFLAGKGSSQCLKGGKMVGCQWDDVSQAEAYAHTLTAFGAAFPEFKGRELYLTDADFSNIFDMTRDEFYTLPMWRQREAKKAEMTAMHSGDTEIADIVQVRRGSPRARSFRD